MAEPAVSAHLNVIIEKLDSEDLKRNARSQGIYSELKQMRIILSQIQALLHDASRRELYEESVRLWLNNLQRLAYDIDGILDDVATEAMSRELDLDWESEDFITKVRNLILTCCTKLSLSQRLHRKLDSITNRLQDLVKEISVIGLVVKDEKQKSNNRGNEISLPEPDVVGREGEKENLINKLLGGESSKQNFSIIPIIGMGGVGKTTLARLLYNDTRVKNHFELQAWVCVSDFDIFKISEAILRCVTTENKEFTYLNQLHMALTEKVQNKRLLLVIDDVWTENYNDWEILVRPFRSCAPGSKIIMTSRKDELLKKLGIDHLDRMESLSDRDALSLLAQHALGVDNFDSDPTLRSKGEGIVGKCGGLPLSLKAIGRLLRTKKREDWDEVLNSEIWDLDKSHDIFPALRLSYHDLSSHLKQLFAYCSLFPKDFLFDKDELVLLWMAEDFLNEPNAFKSLESFGQECFENLLSRSFFQHAPEGKSLFVMHDLIHDLATFVAGNEFFRFNEYTETVSAYMTKPEKYIRMSFIREKYVAYEKFEAFKRANSLRTLLAISIGTDQSWEAFYISSKIIVDILPELPMLRVLCLSRFEITEVPDCIGTLKHLRYVNLSQTKIKELPENVGNLYHLQTLIVFGCACLTKLPESFLNLKMLRHFDIRDTPLLEKLPLGIGKLKSLQTLSRIIIEGDGGFTIEELKELENLNGKISIEGLHNVQSPIHAQKANLSLKRLTKLELKWEDGYREGTIEKDVLNELKPHSGSLEELAIVSYRGTDFPKWVGDPSFQRLVHVSMRGCRKCTSLPPFGKLASLKELFIQDMDEVKEIGSELTGDVDVPFPSLEILWFENMSEWETWSSNNHFAVEVFPCLRELHIKNCPKLIHVNFLIDDLPSLSVLHIERCDDHVLTSLAHASSSITKLEILSIFGLTDEVWRDVIDHLGKVEELRIYRCDEINYLWESVADASKVLVNLKKLYVYNCSNLVSLGEQEEETIYGSNFLSSLTTLDVWHCNNMKHCCCPHNIESLGIGSCSSVTRVSFPTRGGQMLKSLDMSHCNKKLEKIDNRGMPMLEHLYIYDWTNLTSITQFTNCIHLVRLEIYGCSSVESFPELELSKLTSLKFLLIEKCPSMDYSFPSGIWPPYLVSLVIGGLKKPISEWGQQNLPASLVDLTLFGENVSDFSRLSQLLPSSLTRLCIEEFEKLESLSMGLEHLISLQHLFIDNCPKMMHLPETLLPSLLSLRIDECPNLQERCNGRDSDYWPKIYHIPCIEIEHSD